MLLRASILPDNPAYKGRACFGKTALKQGSKKITRRTRLHGGIPFHNKSKKRFPSEKGIEIPVPPLVSEDTFAIAQELLEQNKKLSARRTINPSLLQGLVHCHKCSYTLVQLTDNSSTKKYRYYRCVGSQAWLHPNKKAVCDQKAIRQDVLDDIVWPEIIKLIEDPTLIQTELNRRLEAAQNSSPTKKRQETLNLELMRVQKSMERLVNAYQDDTLSLDELRARLPELRQREKVLKTELHSTKTQAENHITYLKLAETLSSFQSRLRENTKTLDILERQKIVRLLVREIGVSNDKIIIRHSIPTHQFSGSHENIPSNPHSPSEGVNANKNYLLRSGRPNDLPKEKGADQMRAPLIVQKYFGRLIQDGSLF